MSLSHVYFLPICTVRLVAVGTANRQLLQHFCSLEDGHAKTTGRRKSVALLSPPLSVRDWISPPIQTHNWSYHEDPVLAKCDVNELSFTLKKVQYSRPLAHNTH